MEVWRDMKIQEQKRLQGTVRVANIPGKLSETRCNRFGLVGLHHTNLLVSRCWIWKHMAEEDRRQVGWMP